MKNQEKIHYTLFRADIYRILVLILAEPNPKILSELEALTNDLLHDLPETYMPRALKEALEPLTTLLSGLDLNAVQTEYHNLFVTKVTCPVCEGSYHLTERGFILGDVTAFYKAFELQFLTHEGPPDSLKMELAFLSYMALKEANALENNMLREAQITQQAQAKFLLDHLGRWSELFASRLQEATDLSYYKIFSRFLNTWLKMENEYFQIRPVKFPASLSDPCHNSLKNNHFCL